MTLDASTKLLSASGGAGGDLNAFAGYQYSYRDKAVCGDEWGEWSAGAALGSGASGSATVSAPAGYARQFRARTVGAAGATYYSAWVECATLLYGNTAPLAPIILMPAGGSTAKSSAPTIKISCPSEPDGGAQTLRRSIDGGAWTDVGAVAAAGATVYDTFKVNGTAVTVIGDASDMITGSSLLFAVDSGKLYIYGAASPFSIPDGSLATPVNDTATWLACAGLRYGALGSPSLTTVVSNSSLCETLMNSANAVNYMIRSTGIQSYVLGNAVSIAALQASSPYVTPVMTTNSQGGITISATPGYNTAWGDVYKATTESNAAWYSNNTGGADSFTTVAGLATDIFFDFGGAVWPYEIRLSKSFSALPGGQVSNFSAAATATVYGSADNSTWTQLSDTIEGTAAEVTIKTRILYAHSHVRYLRITLNQPIGAAYGVIVKNLKVFYKKTEV